MANEKLEHSVENKNVSRNKNRAKKIETKCQNNVAKFANIILILQHFVFSIMFFAKTKNKKLNIKIIINIILTKIHIYEIYVRFFIYCMPRNIQFLCRFCIYFISVYFFICLVEFLFVNSSH